MVVRDVPVEACEPVSYPYFCLTKSETVCMSAVVVREMKLSASATPSSEARQRFATVGTFCISPLTKRKSLSLMTGPPSVKPYVVLRSFSRAPFICSPSMASPRMFSF